jgi:acetate kinase
MHPRTGPEALPLAAGVGEHAPRIRAEGCHGLECLGVHRDSDSNASLAPEADLSPTDSSARS